jgi:hypothetical protein
MAEIILMPLIDEGADVWRPVEAEPLGDGAWRVLGPAPYGETWAFAPGTVVRCERRDRGGETVLAAVSDA